jgi:predicted GIY-YIG superfamily endonuclease
MSVWVYAMVSLKNGATYVGVSSNPAERAYVHVLDIEKRQHQSKAVRRHFKNHTRADIRFEKLEFVPDAENGWSHEARLVEAKHIALRNAINKPLVKRSRMEGIQIVDVSASAPKSPIELSMSN